MIRLFLADADLNRAIVVGVIRRNSAIDFKRAEQVPLESMKDPDVLAAAAIERRVLVSHDVSTMPNHFRDFVRRQRSPGLIVIPQDLNIGKAIDSLILIAEAYNHSHIENRVCLVPSLATYGF